MDDQELRSLLERLHREIEHNQPLDEKERELLQQLGEDIHELLARPEGKGTQAEASMIKRLEESIDHYEITYPDLTLLLNELLAILSNAGI
jgi:cob(I)alamin adenosyltransferase